MVFPFGQRGISSEDTKRVDVLCRTLLQTHGKDKDKHTETCKIVVGWATKPYVVVVDILDDFECRKSLFDMLHGVVHMETVASGEHRFFTQDKPISSIYST